MKIGQIARKVLLAVVALAAIVVVVFAAILIFDSAFPGERVEYLTNVSFPGLDGKTLNAYLTLPQGEGPFPAVLMIHEFYGLRSDVIKKADLLAQEGYAVLAMDAYRGKTTTLVPRAIWLVVTTPQDRIADDVDASFAYLAALPSVDTTRVGVVGFCFGGTQAMKLGTRSGQVAANVIFYGSGLLSDPQALGSLGQGGPVLGIFGAEDASIPQPEVRAFEAALQAQGIAHTITVYPGVGHAFVNSESLAQPGAAQQAWQQMKDFFAQNLK